MDKKIILDKLKEYKAKSPYKAVIKDLGLFGSYANGNNTESSDVDVFVKLKPARMFDLAGIKNDLEELLGKKVDVIALRNSMNKYLKKEIKDHGLHA
ncbi:MAG: nucleotidyltransferase domain-containing protein [Ignavibacteria bacterium]